MPYWLGACGKHNMDSDVYTYIMYAHAHMYGRMHRQKDRQTDRQTDTPTHTRTNNVNTTVPLSISDPLPPMR